MVDRRYQILYMSFCVMSFVCYLASKQMRPGCVILQAAMGGSSVAAQQFHSSTWLLSPTPDLKVYPITEEQLKDLVERVEKQHTGHKK